MWKIEKIVSKGDYNYAIVRDHPNATKNGYVLEHRIVIENHLGRLLNSDEIVHHKNGSKKDNRIENLEAMAASEHAQHHGKEGSRKCVELKCPHCGKHFIKYHNHSFLAKGTMYTACSRSCNGSFCRIIQMHGRTPEVERAISGNLVREFYSHDNPEETVDDRIRRGHTPAA